MNKLLVTSRLSTVVVLAALVVAAAVGRNQMLWQRGYVAPLWFSASRG